MVIGLSFARVRARKAMTIGIYAAILGSIGIVGGASAGSLATMFAGQAVAGLAFGAAFTAALGLVIPLVAAHHRAGVVAGIYVVSYLGLGVPVVLAGQLTDVLGVVPTVELVQRGGHPPRTVQPRRSGAPQAPHSPTRKQAEKCHPPIARACSSPERPACSANDSSPG